MAAVDQFKTVSERHFAEYLDVAGYTWEYEPTILGERKKPDFRISADTDVLADVKERSPKDFVPGARLTDPVSGIRKLIEKGRMKFKSFDDHVCALVVFNVGDQETRLEPHWIFAAMLGDFGFTANFRPNGLGIDRTSLHSEFLPRGGKMIKHYSTFDLHESTRNISAIIALATYRVPNPKFEMTFSSLADEKAIKLARPLNGLEQSEVMHQLLSNGVPMSLGDTWGVTVCLNPFAKHRFPKDLFNGRFDEQWSMTDGGLTRIFFGEQRAAIVQIGSDESDNF